MKTDHLMVFIKCLLSTSVCQALFLMLRVHEQDKSVGLPLSLCTLQWRRVVVNAM